MFNTIIYLLFYLVFEESFSLLDRDGDGSISHSEIHSLMNSLGYSPSHEDISSVISKVDIDGEYGAFFEYYEEFSSIIQVMVVSILTNF